MAVQNFIGDRLKNARLFRAITLAELAEQTDVTKQVLSQYENGTTKPSGSTLFALARALCFPVEYFFTDQQISIDAGTTYFRALMSTNKKHRIAQTVRLGYIAQIYEVLSDYVAFPHLNTLNISFPNATPKAVDGAEEANEIEKIAREIREYWNLGTEPINDLRYVLEANGIVVTCVSLNANEIDAFSQRTLINGKEAFFIVVSKEDQTVARARFDMAHELAHILLHPWSEEIESISREEFKARERQANALAGALLLPKEAFSRDISPYPTTLEYYRHLKKKWKVSIAAMIYRSYQLGIITTNQFQYLMKQMTKLGWRIKEPDDTQFLPQGTLLQSAVEMLLQNNVLSVDDFMDALKQRGIVMNQADIEDLLCLHGGSLMPSIQSLPPLPAIKKDKPSESIEPFTVLNRQSEFAATKPF